MLKLPLADKLSGAELLSSQLYNQDAFYSGFTKDLLNSRSGVIIESPFITESRINQLMPLFQKLRRRRIEIVVNTRNPNEHNETYYGQAVRSINELQGIGVKVLYTVGHHRKLAIIDGYILWEGSLNILSYNDSCEVMRRISSVQLAHQMLEFINIERFM